MNNNNDYDYKMFEKILEKVEKIWLLLNYYCLFFNRNLHKNIKGFPSEIDFKTSIA